MTSIVLLGQAASFVARSTPVPEYNSAFAGVVMAIERLPTEPVGTFSLTLTNLVIGSAIQVETQAGAPIESRTAGAGSEAFSIPAYSTGNPSNDLRIKVRKGSGSPFYIPWETLAAALVGAQAIYVSQIPDE